MPCFQLAFFSSVAAQANTPPVDIGLNVDSFNLMAFAWYSIAASSSLSVLAARLLATSLKPSPNDDKPCTIYCGLMVIREHEFSDKPTR